VTTTASRCAALRRLADQILEVGDLDGLTRLLTRALPAALGQPGSTLLVWNRRLDSFEALAPGETHLRPVRPEARVPAPDARHLISEGQLLEIPGGHGEAVLLPLMARTRLAGMLVLAPRAGRRRARPYSAAEVRLLSNLAARAALAIENQLYQRELIASERVTALGSMAGMLAHDLRGPMTVIRGYAETLQEGAVAEADVRERARIIVEMVDRLERMTAETLDFARGGGRLAALRVDVLLLLHEWLADIATQLPGLRVERDLEVPAGTLAQLDPDKLRRALTNLAANAHEAMQGRGRLRVRARLEVEATGRVLELLLSDEGPGVAAEVRERLFEPFVTAGKPYGTGLGLAVARHFVEDHGGSLVLLPDSPGAHFRVRLPLPLPAPPPGA
jgi:signal transduction histidine kinase